MGLLSKLIGGSIGEMANGVASAINQFVETPEEKKAADALLMKIQQEPDKWQALININEAKHRSIFIAGWRPFIGWVCGVGLAYAVILRPVFIFVIKLLAVWHEIPPELAELPVIDTAALITLLLSMLGLASTRTYEKKKGLTG